MKTIDRSEVLAMGEYEAIRPHFRARVIDQKKQRRAELGEHMSVVFENRDTVLLQIQEMIRTERISADAAIQHEIATYNELVPAEDELSMTLFIEIADREARDAMLTRCAGMESCVWLVVDGSRAQARASERDGQIATRTTAVQYYKVPLGPLAARLRDGGARSVAVEVDHPSYRARTELSPAVVAQLRADLTWS
jgi:hypothetical protein